MASISSHPLIPDGLLCRQAFRSSLWMASKTDTILFQNQGNPLSSCFVLRRLQTRYTWFCLDLSSPITKLTCDIDTGMRLNSKCDVSAIEIIIIIKQQNTMNLSITFDKTSHLTSECGFPCTRCKIHSPGRRKYS